MASHIERRKFLATLGGAAAAWPLAARAQQPTTPVIGFIHPGSASAWPFGSAFRRGLQDAGYVEGQNVAIEYRWADSHYERLSALAVDLVAKQVGVIVVGGGTAPIHAAKAATGRIPIVFFTGTDPVADGLVENFARPSGNLTGAYVLNNVLVGKQLEIMHEAVPTATTIAVLDNQSGPSAGVRLRELNGAALTLGLNCKFSMPAPKARSPAPSRVSSRNARAGSWSAPIRSSPAGAIKSPGWRCVTGCR
jgi:putative ABC transport system substrate-binding protein